MHVTWASRWRPHTPNTSSLIIHSLCPFSPPSSQRCCHCTTDVETLSCLFPRLASPRRPQLRRCPNTPLPHLVSPALLRVATALPRSTQATAMPLPLSRGPGGSPRGNQPLSSSYFCFPALCCTLFLTGVRYAAAEPPCHRTPPSGSPASVLRPHSHLQHFPLTSPSHYHRLEPPARPCPCLQRAPATNKGRAVVGSQRMPTRADRLVLDIHLRSDGVVLNEHHPILIVRQRSDRPDHPLPHASAARPDRSAPARQP